MEHVRQHPDRRLVLQSAMAAVVAMMGPVGYAGTSRPPLGFTAVPASLRDAVVVPPEYEYHVLYRWGDPTGIGSSLPAFRPDASNTAEDQALQAGMHHDGMHFFPLGSDGRRALLVLNHCLLYTSPSPRDRTRSRMPSSA